MLTPPRTFDLPHITLRPPVVSDAEAMFACGSDPEVGRFADWPLATSIDRTIARIQGAGERWDSGEEYRWILALPETDEAVGAISLFADGHAAEFGFLVQKRHWGNGYATEAACAVVDWVMDQPAIWRIWATCDCENLASIRVLEKAGLSQEGRLRRATVRPNLSPEPRDAYLYAKVKM
ncbi:GNAT family N-acetyltransferase [Luteolibacter luteus]|uniref:GNAT family N-acetyltransferase n=1 Tax=Luteolibacter luteus TaxID=2728835 RepID=A0A858RPV1_9BACT|nr:GNAT family N-acetyltransferase [Luteolibacter luteus]QJE99057.1 GNAT family N-acetyltransferase [Luteolibacter luteus]